MTGNLSISLVAGTVSTAVLLVLGVPYAVALGLIVGLLDLIPLAGATLAAIIVSAVGFLHSTTAGIVLVIFFVVYQQLENHVLQPLVYGRTVQLSPLIVLIAVLMGAELAGVIGALGAIPVAGSIQVVLLDWLAERRRRLVDPPGPPPRPPSCHPDRVATASRRAAWRATARSSPIRYAASLVGWASSPGCRSAWPASHSSSSSGNRCRVRAGGPRGGGVRSRRCRRRAVRGRQVDRRGARRVLRRRLVVYPACSALVGAARCGRGADRRDRA